ncbi:hypothetical protein DSCO28_61700 [Desulfosarcina ovata subsp. sediminis]|uniref:FlgO domain-containing protein n=3 Tax=Desulfosarcina ovata TaxID=83564 RepID=A0A5K8ALG4_9BACT|nr:hypothetical protein DSCO28_61700 [Desulfosarcina ovata subsp. sediminis]BBO92640.1 hypothetical protein DSCOOX_58200 [Desulfosarcina ovata subsp. ovata]
MWSIRERQYCIQTFLYIFPMLTGLLIGFSGCATFDGKADNTINLKTVPYSEILEASYAAADVITSDLKKRIGDRDGTIISASLVNINDLEESCPLGRLISEQVSSRVARHGYHVLEMKLRQRSVYIKKGQGEFLLSREIKELSKTHNSAFVIVGTYAVAEGSVYVSIRVVDAVENTIVTGCEYQLERNYQTNSLLTEYLRGCLKKSV